MGVAAIRPATSADVGPIRDLIQAAFTPYLPRLGGRVPAPMEADYAALVAQRYHADPPPRGGGGGRPRAVERAAGGALFPIRGVSHPSAVDALTAPSTTPRAVSLPCIAAPHGGSCAPSRVHVLTDADEELTGVLVLRLEPGHLLVETVAVRPARQGTGIGRRLLRFAEARARDLGYRALRLYTAEAMTESLALYGRCGWIELGRGAPTGIPRVYLGKSVG